MTLIKRSLMEHRPQEIGKIKLGGRGAPMKASGGGKAYIPQKFDHFEVVTRARQSGDGAFLRDEAVHSQVGQTPRELAAHLMFPEVEQNLRTVMAEYAGKKPKVVCDGEVQRNQQGVESPCARARGGTCGCRPYARLQVQLDASPHTGGYYVFRTRSWESVNNIQTALEEFYARFGTLFMAPVKLITYQSDDQYTQDGQDRTGKSWKVAIVLNLPYEQAALMMAESKERLEGIRERLMLTAGEVQEALDARDVEEADEIADEFDPPRGVEASVRTQEALDAVVEGLEPVRPPQAQESSVEPASEDPHTPESEPVAETGADAPDLRFQVFEARDRARGRKLLDKKAEQYIQHALDTDDATELNKALLALKRALGE